MLGVEREKFICHTGATNKVGQPFWPFFFFFTLLSITRYLDRLSYIIRSDPVITRISLITFFLIHTTLANVCVTLVNVEGLHPESGRTSVVGLGCVVTL